MKRSVLLNCTAACVCLAMAFPLSAAPAPDNGSAPVKAAEPTAVAGAACRADVQNFSKKMEKDGYWLGGSGYGYGYPMGGAGYGYGYGYGSGVGGYASMDASGLGDARPGYELRILLASANILAQKGQQQACEEVLVTTRAVYEHYAAEMHARGMQAADEPGWQQKEIAAARPVAEESKSFRSDELLDTPVRTPGNEALGSVQDILMSPKTGKIAYLVIARGGIFGIDQKYVPIPWDDFKATKGVSLLVLDATKAAMDAAPEVDRNQVLTAAQFDTRSQEVDTYWKTHLAN